MGTFKIHSRYFANIKEVCKYQTPKGCASGRNFGVCSADHCPFVSTDNDDVKQLNNSNYEKDKGLYGRF